MRREAAGISYAALVAGVFLSALPDPLYPESHHEKAHRNCRVESQVPLPRRKTGEARTAPAWRGWRLKHADGFLSAAGDSLACFDLAGKTQILRKGLGVEFQVQAGQSDQGIYVLAAPRLGSAKRSPITLSAYGSSAHQLLWERTPFPNSAFPLLAGPLVIGDAVVAGAGENIAAFNAADGRELWSRSLEGFIGTNPASDGNIVLLVTVQGIEALSLSNGESLWRHPLSRAEFNPSRPIVLSSGIAYVPLSEKILGTLDIGSGRLLWQSPRLPFLMDFRHPPVVVAPGIIIPVFGGLARLNSTGAQVWARKYPFLEKRQGAPALLAADNAVFMGGEDGLYALSHETGEILWKAEGLGQIEDIEYSGSELLAVESQGMVHRFAP